MRHVLARVVCAAWLAAATVARAEGPAAAPQPAAPSATPQGAAATPAVAAAAEEPSVPEKTLPPEHQPQLHVTLDPARSVHSGEVVRLQITADALLGDDVTVAEQTFVPFEVHKKRARVEQPSGQRQRFVFDLELLGLAPSDKPVPPIELRVVTKDGFVASVKTPELPYAVRSRLANEPNAQPKLETKPLPVMQDNWWPVYLALGVLAVALVAGLTLLLQRYLRSRKKSLPPPAPKRPAWDIAVEKLGELRRQKQRMLEAGHGGLFVDQVSDAVREYLGARYAFDGLETTSDEMLGLLRKRNAGVGFTQEVGVFLGRCDLVKFAKVEPNQDEADVIFGKAHDLVQGSRPALTMPAMPAMPHGAQPLPQPAVAPLAQNVAPVTSVPGANAVAPTAPADAVDAAPERTPDEHGGEP